MSAYNLTLKQKIDVETRKLFVKNSNNHLATDDKKYTKLLLSIITSNLFQTANENSQLWVDFFIYNDNWLHETSKKIYASQYSSSIVLEQINHLKEFILMYEKCIKADINSIKEIMISSNKEFSYKNPDKSLFEYASTFNIEIFEAPKHHMLRIWILRSSRIILDHYPNSANDFMKRLKCFNNEIFFKIHKTFSNTVFNSTMSSRYYSYYKSDQHKNYTIKLMKYLQKNNIQLKDLDDPFFHLEEFEEPKLRKMPINETNHKIRCENNNEEYLVPRNNEILDMNKKKKMDLGLKLDEIEEVHGNQSFPIEPTQTESKFTSTNGTKKSDSASQTDFLEIPSVQKIEKKLTNSSSQTENSKTNFHDNKQLKIDASTQSEALLKPVINLIVQPGTSILSKHLINFYENGKYTDILILTDTDKKYKVHSCVLAGYSKVFTRMFDNKLKIIKISKTPTNTIDAMIKFMYTNTIDNLEEIVFDLIIAAQEYEIQELIDICEKCLLNKINLQNAAYIFFLADKCKCENLKEEAKKFISTNNNIKEIMETDGFKSIKILNPNLIIDLLLYQVKNS